MLVFEEQQRYIAWHTDATAAGSVVPFDVHASKLLPTMMYWMPWNFLRISRR
jgi:hypothetical protein